MKNLILCLFLIAFIAVGNSQILLEEAHVEYRSESMKVDPVTNSLTFIVPERTAGEFQSNPLNFMQKNFDAKKFIKDNDDVIFSGFDVKFKSSKGYLLAYFNNRGDLKSSKQHFRNIRLPKDALQELNSQYADAVVLNTEHNARSKGWEIKKEFYKVKIKTGDRNKIVRINRDNDRYGLAGL